MTASKIKGDTLIRRYIALGYLATLIDEYCRDHQVDRAAFERTLGFINSRLQKALTWKGSLSEEEIRKVLTFLGVSVSFFKERVEAFCQDEALASRVKTFFSERKKLRTQMRTYGWRLFTLSEKRMVAEQKDRNLRRHSR